MLKPQEPSVPLSLLEWLEFHFPDQVPDEGDTPEKVWLKVGRVQVVRKLRHLYENQLKQSITVETK